MNAQSGELRAWRKPWPIRHLAALVALHDSYTWRGVWTWLRSPDVRLPGSPPMRGPGWALWLSRPTAIHAHAEALSDGAFI